MSGLQNKLYNYEQIPAERVWEKVVAALDESHIEDEFPSKIYNAETTPPAAAWDKIASSLKAEHPDVILMPRKSFPLLRYAAAAIVIGFVTFGVIKWANKKSGSPGKGIVVSKETTPAQQPTFVPDQVITRSKIPAETSEQNNIAVVVNEPMKKSQAKKFRQSYSISDNIDAGEPIYAYNEPTPNLADKYIMLMTPDGGIIRVSKKWGHLVCCVSGQDQDEDCKDQLKKWQEKIACSSVAQSTGNFMDILSLVSSLNDSDL